MKLDLLTILVMILGILEFTFIRGLFTSILSMAVVSAVTMFHIATIVKQKRMQAVFELLFVIMFLSAYISYM